MNNELEISVFNHLAQGIAVCNSQLEILKHNIAFASLFSIKNPTNLRADQFINNLTTKSLDDFNLPVRREINSEITIEYFIKPIGSNNWLLEVRDVSALIAAEKDIHFRANYDQLTEIPNRSLFNDRCQQALSAATRHKTKLAIMFIDLDDFKKINDSLGHDAGDAVLIEVSKRLSLCIRESDTVARWAGDEFTILLANVQSTKNIEHLAKRILNELNKPLIFKSKKMKISVSIGISLFPNSENQLESLVNQADKAMYKAKLSGKNTYEFF